MIYRRDDILGVIMIGQRCCYKIIKSFISNGQNQIYLYQLNQLDTSEN